MLWYARSQRSWASGRSSAARRIRHSRFIVSSVPTDLGGRIFRAHGEHVDPRRCREAQPARPAEREPPAPGHAEFIFCDQSIERTFSWIDQNRRMSKDYERLCASGEAFVYAAMIRLMTRRLVRV
jgi:Transposase DDE domain